MKKIYKIFFLPILLFFFIGIMTSEVNFNIQDVRMPIIYFRYNSLTTVLFNCDTDSFKVSMEKVSKAILGNPSTYIAVNGYADKKENKPKALALKRAMYIKNELIKFGLTTDRVAVKSYGTDKMIFSDSLILSKNNKVIADSLRQMNRCVTFSVFKKQ